MKTKLLMPVAGLLLLATTGCLWSVHPLYTEESVVFEPGLVGVWATADGEKTAIVRAGEDKSYEITYVDKDISDGASAKYRARLVRLGEFLFLDVRPDRKAVDELMGVAPLWYLLPAHTFYRLQLSGDVLTVSQVDDELVTQASATPLAHEEVGEKGEDSGYLLTASSAEIAAQLSKRAADEAIYEKLGEFRRLK